MRGPLLAVVLVLFGGILLLLYAELLLVSIVEGDVNLLRALVTIYPELARVVEALSPLVVGLLGLLFAVVVLVSAVLIAGGEPSRVKAGSITALVFGALSAITGGGFIIGLALTVAGGVVGLAWRPQD